MNKITFKRLTEADLHPNILDNYRRYQVVTKVFRDKDGEYILEDDHFISEWSLETRRENAQELIDCIKSGGVAIVVFDEGELIGFAAVAPELFGSRKQYAELITMQISDGYRGQGLGKKLFSLTEEAARSLGAEKLYISGHPAYETQMFYRSVGCTRVQEPDPKRLEKEPWDCHLEKKL